MTEQFDSVASCDNIIATMSSSRSFFEIAGIFCVSLFLFTWGVGSQEVIGFESRFYLFAQEMWRYGAGCFPTSYHQPYPDYPGTATLLIYLSAKMLGGMSKLAAVLPSAIAAAITVVMTYLIGAERNKRWGLYAVFFLFFTIMFLKSARSIGLDIYPTMIAASCFYLIYADDNRNKHVGSWLVYLLLIIGFAFRGPIGLVIPAGVVCAYYLQEGNFKRLFSVGVMAALLLIFSLLVLLAIAHASGGYHFAHSVLQMEIFGRMTSSYAPVYFYFVNSMRDYAISFPLVLIVTLGVLYYEQLLHHHSADLKLLIKLIGFILVVLLGMSIPGDKKIRYVLPMAPALALMAAYPFVATSKERYFTWLSWLLLRLFLFIPAVMFVGLRYVLAYANEHQIDFHINYLLMTQIFFLALGGNVLLFVTCAKRHAWRDTGVLLMATLSFVAGYLMVVEPIEQFMDRTREFVVQTEVARKQAHADLVFYKEKPDSMPIKYLINMPIAEMPIFIGDESALVGYPKAAYFVTSAAYFAALPMTVAQQYRIIARDKIGHVAVVVFTNK